MHLDKFPMDIQTCPLTFGSRKYRGPCKNNSWYLEKHSNRNISNNVNN